MIKEEHDIVDIKKEDRYGEDYYFKILNKHRYILLYDEINNMAADVVVSKLLAMNLLDRKKTIIIEINSPGGSVADGMSIINAIEHISAPVTTVITGQACSMAALISICADKRLIYSNSYWMQHSTSDLVGDYINYIKDRTRFLCEFEHRTEKMMKLKTKLSNTDITKIRTGELWLNADQALAKGVVDYIIPYKNKKVK